VGKTRFVLPTFANAEAEEIYRKEQLAAAFRVLARNGHAEGIAGHCSVRSRVDPTKFYINPWTKSFFRMKASDLVLVSAADGAVVESDSPVQSRSVDASATGLHAPIYRKCEDVQAIVHVHGPHSKAFSSLGKPLDMINQDVCAFDNAVIDIPFQGVVLDEDEGGLIGSRLAPTTKIALLQNHGSLAIGRTSIDEAAWWFLSFEMCCHAQLLADAALAPGQKPLFVSDEARTYTAREIGSPEMGWLSFAGYYEREEFESGGEFKN